jgi:hypothetical protein
MIWRSGCAIAVRHREGKSVVLGAPSARALVTAVTRLVGGACLGSAEPGLLGAMVVATGVG